MKKIDVSGQPRGVWLWLCGAGMAALFFLGLFWGLPSMLTPASDSIAPLGPLAFAADLKDPTKSYIYPAVHQITLLALYAVALAIGKVAGAVGTISGTFPYGFHNPTAVFSVLIFLSHMLSALMALAVLAFVLKIRILPESQAWFGAALIGLSGVFVYYARVSNMDVPYLFWWMLSYSALWTYLFRRAETRYVVISGAAGALAIGTKDQSLALLLGAGLAVLLLPSIEPAARGWPARIKASAIFSAALFGCYFAVAVITNPQRWLRHFHYIINNHATPGCDCSCFACAEFPMTVLGQMQLAVRVLDRMGHIITPVGVMLGFLGMAVIAAKRQWKEFWFIALPASTYYLIVFAGVRSTEERYILPLAILTAIAGGVAVGWTWEVSKTKALRLAIAAGAGGILAFQLIAGAFPVTYVQFMDTKRALSRDLPQLVPQGSDVLVVNMFSFGLPNASVYEHYHLMHPPGEIIQPPSVHAEHLFSPFSPDYRFVLSGAHTPYSEEYLTGAVQLRSWTYPDWIKRHVYVPAIHEFALYQRK